MTRKEIEEFGQRLVNYIGFNVGEIVWHRSSKDEGVITDIGVTFDQDGCTTVLYVIFGPGVVVKCNPQELTHNKQVE